MAVAAGSIAFVAFDFDNTTTQSKTEGFAFVALRPIAASDSIRFVDGNWNGTSFDGLDGQIVWQNNTGAAIPAGRLIEVSVGGVGALTSLTPTTNLGTISGKSGTWGRRDRRQPLRGRRRDARQHLPRRLRRRGHLGR